MSKGQRSVHKARYKAKRFKKAQFIDGSCIKVGKKLF